MENVLSQPLHKIEERTYLGVLMLLAPLLNFLSGVSIDLYAPSLPSIAKYFDVSIMTAKNTITATMLGFAIACLFIGVLIDIYGRRKTILLSLIIFIIVSLWATQCHTITELMLVRFTQGMMIAVLSIGCRVLVADNFTGHRFMIAILYTSVAYGLGPVIAPFVGGLLQYHFGWQANFFAYAILAIFLFALVMLYVADKENIKKNVSFINLFRQYGALLKHKVLLAAILVQSIVLIQQMVYPTVGSFIVENLMHRTPVTYGYTALMIGASYLIGTLVNRIMIGKISIRSLMIFGFCFMGIAMVLQIVLALTTFLTLTSLISPILIVGFSLGFIFPNMVGSTLKMFPNQAGLISAVQAFSLMLIGGIGVFIISHFNIQSLTGIAWMYSVLFIIQVLAFIYLASSAKVFPE